MNIYDATSLAELVKMLKEDKGESNDSLGAKIGIGATTVQRVLQGYNVDDTTLDKIATYAVVPRDWLYELAKGVKTEKHYSRIVTMIAEMLEQAPADVQELFFIQARAVIESRNKSGAKTN